MVTTRSSTRGASVPPADVAKPPARARVSKAVHATFTHTPTRLTLAWLVISCAVVTWDFTYVFLRPHSMPGGALHAFWAPYALYGEIDYVYGRSAFDAGEGFAPAQSAMNVVETLMYLVYLAAVHRGSGKLSGQHGKVVLLVGFSAAVMTLSKTVLYWANEIFSGFSNIGHNKISDLIILWIIPNGLWIVMPIYMVIVMGKDVIAGMDTTSTKLS